MSEENEVPGGLHSMASTASRADTALDSSSTGHTSPSRANPISKYSPARSTGRPRFDESLTTNLKLPDELICRLPGNILEWEPDHCVLWLEEIFKGAVSHLAEYRKKFVDLGVNGLDLMNMSTQTFPNFSAYEIKDELHVDRMLAHLHVLACRQNDYNAEAEYLRLKEQYVQTPAYILPRKMDTWKPADVMFFVLRDGIKDTTRKFVKPLEASRINGAELLKCCREGKFDLRGLQAEELEVTRFREVVLKHYRNQAELRQRKNNHTAVGMGMRVIPQSKVIRKLQLPSGSYGILYLCELEKRKVVTKELADQQDTNSTVARRILEVQGNSAGRVDEGELQKAEAAHSDALTEDLLYEAKMLWRAAGPGILQLFGVIEGKDTRPKIVTEYLSGNTVEQEYIAARKDNSESIFHERHEGNLNKKLNKIKDPVLLQKVRIARDVAAALARLHAEGIIHLDIAARNIFLDAGKRPKIGDFGMAAMEADMKEQYELRKLDIQEHVSGGLLAPGEIELQLQIDAEARQATDENAVRMHNMHMGKRPVKWMPDWVIDCGDPSNPLIDRHADVYSFGCLMYEMAMLQHPHAEFSLDEVKFMKRERRGNPTVPEHLDQRYTSIMQTCWNSYELQPTMDDVAKDLAELHRQLIAESYDGDAAYTEFKDYAQAVVAKTGPPSAGDVYNDSISAAEAKVKAAARKAPAGPPGERPNAHSYPIIAGGRVRLRFPPNIDINDVDKLYEFEDAGVSVEKLKSVLHCAYHFNDTLTIATYMQCICVEDSATQVSMLVECLQYIERLAKDEHGSADDPETWHMLCSKVLGVAQTAVTFTATSHLSALEQSRLKVLIFNVLSALCALLDIKSFDMTIVSEDKTIALVRDMAAVSIGSLRSFPDSADVVDKAAAVVFQLAAKPHHLYEAGAVGTLLDALRIQESEGKVPDNPENIVEAMQGLDSVNIAAASCVKALGSFPLSCLCKPRPKSRLPQQADKAPVHGEVFDAISRSTERFLHLLTLLQSENGSSEATVSLSDCLTEKLVLCLQTLFQACESSVMEPQYIESFMFTLTSANISMLFEVIKNYRDHDNFVLQESAIGLLAHIVKCGAGIRNAELVTELPPLPARERFDIVLDCDPSFELLLAVMTKFGLSGVAVNSIYDGADAGAHAQEELNIGASNPVYSPAPADSRVGPLTAHFSYDFYRSVVVDIDANLHQLLQKEVVVGQQERLLFEDAMQQLTAASLQKSVAVIVGAGCNSNKVLQNEMVRTSFNESILRAFKNYGNDAQLIEKGCHALFSVCRCHAMHQKMLGEADIMKHLLHALRSHRKVWQIVDGVMCAILGLLEPQDPTVLTTSGRSTCDGMRVAQAITTDIKFDSHDATATTLIKWLALAVAEFQINGDCGKLVSNYMRLISMTLLWLPDMLDNWNTLFVDLRGTRVALKCLLLAFREIGRVGGNSGAGGAAGTVEHALSPKATVAFNIYNSGCDLVNFILLSQQFHQGQKNVRGSGFAVLTAVYQRAVPAGIAFGKELPYATEQKLRELRTRLLSSDVPGMCLSTIKSNMLSDNEHVIIRYTLWLLILFISESSESGTEASSTASDVSLEEGVEWAIKVLQKFTKFYSLQCLATVFLIWMEQHGKLRNRSIAQLRDLQALLIAAREREDSYFFKLADEGYDPYMLSKTKQMFGDRRAHAVRLLGALAKTHLRSQAIPGIATKNSNTSEKVSPYEVTVASVQHVEDAATHAMFTAYMVKVKWDAHTEWTVPKRFKKFLHLQAELSADLSHIPFNSAPLVEPKKRFMRRRNDQEMQECRILLNAWLGRIMQHRPVALSRALRQFISATKLAPANASVKKIELIAPQSCPVQQQFPVTCVYYDNLAELMFVASGLQQVSWVTSLFAAKERGSVAVFDIQAHTNTGVTPVEQNRGVPPLVRALYSVGATCVTYDAKLHCVYVGLADGSILFYNFVLDNPCTLSCVGEIKCHSFPICAMISNHTRHRLIAASAGSTLSVFNTRNTSSKVEIISQEVLVNGTFTSVAYYATMNWCFCGTSVGTVVVYDTSDDPAKLPLCEICVSAIPSDVKAIFLLEEHHLLYLAVRNEVVALNLPCSTSSLPNVKLWTRISLAGSLVITSMNVLATGQYITVTCQSTQAITVIDMTSTASNVQAQHAVDPLATSSGKLALWSEVITQSEDDIRIWLQGHSVDSADILGRAALLQAVRLSAGITEERLAEELRVAKPRREVLLSAAVMHGTPTAAITCSVYVHHERYIIVGGSDGSVVLLSLDGLVPNLSQDEKKVLTIARESLTWEVQCTAPAIKVVNTSTSGRRHQLRVDTSKRVELESPIKSTLLDKYSVKALREVYHTLEPCKYLVLKNLCTDRRMRKIRDEVIRNMKANFAVFQTQDLPTLKSAEQTFMPQQQSLRRHIYSPEFRQFVTDVTGCGDLTDRVDCSCNVHAHGCHVPCQDNYVGTRRVWYIIFLTDPDEPWTEADGGAVELHPQMKSATVPGDDNADNIPSSVPACHVLPVFNTMLLFTVQPGRGYHSMQEVFNAKKPRLSISGWYHAIAHLGPYKTLECSSSESTMFPEITCSAGEDKDISTQELEYLSCWINPTYLVPATIADIRGQFCANSSLQLNAFIRPDLADKLTKSMIIADETQNVGHGKAQLNYTLGTSDAWQLVGPPHKRRHLVYNEGAAASTAAEIAHSDSVGAQLDAIRSKLFRSAVFAKYLRIVTALDPIGYKDEVRRFRSGLDYTVAHYGVLTKAARLAATLCFVNEDLTLQERIMSEHTGVPIEKVPEAVVPTITKKAAAPTEAAPQRALRPAPVRSSQCGHCKTAAKANTETCKMFSGHGVAIHCVKCPKNIWDHDKMGGFECYTKADESADNAKKNEPRDLTKTTGSKTDQAENLLLSAPVANNTLTLVMCAVGITKLVKHVSAKAPGSRWDIAAEYEIGTPLHDSNKQPNNHR